MLYAIAGLALLSLPSLLRNRLRLWPGVPDRRLSLAAADLPSLVWPGRALRPDVPAVRARVAGVEVERWRRELRRRLVLRAKAGVARERTAVGHADDPKVERAWWW